jgi:CheY-like chemotaxis protein
MRILLVEDDASSREALRVLLEILGHEVDEATNGEQAVALAVARRPDLIFLDVGLPRLNGHEVAKRIRDQPGGDAFFVVAFTGHQRWERAPAEGFDAYLVKPAAIDQLDEVLAAASERLSRQAVGDQGRRTDETVPPRTRLVLVVEDDAALMDAMVVALEHEGYQVVPAAHGQEALDLLHRGVQPRAIILDLMMPVMNGWDFRRAQLADPDLAAVPVIVVSAHHEANRLAGSPGVREVLVKPIDLDRLLDLVEAACAA